jgi:hypothetical protein
MPIPGVPEFVSESLGEEEVDAHALARCDCLQSLEKAVIAYVDADGGVGITLYGDMIWEP